MEIEEEEMGEEMDKRKWRKGTGRGRRGQHMAHVKKSVQILASGSLAPTGPN